MAITRLVIKNYRGIEARDIEVHPAGFTAAGRNGAGKTSILTAIRAALAGQDIGPDAIRAGADKAEILVDMNDVSVRRAISKKGNTLVVTRDGMTAQKPQAFLTELLGTSPLDPLDLFLAKPKDRRAVVLSALPVSVTPEQLAAWAPVPQGFDVSGHALDVVDRLRKYHYSARSTANLAAKEKRGAAERAIAAADALRPDGAGAPALDEARANLEKARAEGARLNAQQQAAIAGKQRAEKSRKRIADLREKARATSAGAPRPADASILSAQQIIAGCEAAVRELEAKLLAAREDHLKACAACDMLFAQRLAFDERMTEADAIDAQATELENTLNEAAIVEVTPEEWNACEAAMRRAERAEARATTGAALQKADDAAREADRQAKTAEAMAAQLDGWVRALTDAPAKLLSSAQGIDGVTLDDDDVFLNGVRMDALSGAEQMRFAVDVAKRLNAKSKLLVVDGLERLDPEQLDRFVSFATSGGYQLIASRVDRGDVEIIALEASVAEQAAE